MRTTLSICLLSLVAVATGCQSVARPRLWGPGPADSQQRAAQVFDPYPDNDIGPAIVGGRPQDYENPPAEVKRARWTRNFPYLFQR